jgi:hypothetical protein
MDAAHRTSTSLIVATLLAWSSTVVASDDAYLKMLEGEAEDLQLDQSGQLKDKASDNSSSSDTVNETEWKWEGDLMADSMPKGLAQDKFSTVLKRNFYGTYVFYRKLNSVDQQTVYYHYSKSTNPDLDSIRQHILSLLKK